MCGIVGKLHLQTNQLAKKDDLLKMANALKHRGPDDEGFYVDGAIGLGHRRLSVIDLSPSGHQPMNDATGRYHIIFNGEIYNFQELRAELKLEGVQLQSQSDTEVIIYLYKKLGPDCLKKLRGMFAFAIWDSQDKSLFIARDRVGKKPLKYYHDSNVFIFASELKAILTQPEVIKEPDWQAIDEYLTYQYVPSPKTGFKNIYKLEPASYLIIKDGKITKQKYWSLDFTKKLALSEQEWEKAVLDKLNEAIKLRLISDVPLGAHLSGGIDSSLIVVLMASQSKTPVKTFSIGFKEDRFNELPFARLVADRYNTEHHEFVVEPNAIEVLEDLVYHYEEPYADSSALPTWYLAKLTRQHVTVALNGDGGDENFAGYSRYNALKLWRQLKFIPFKGALKAINQALYRATKIPIFRKGYRFLEAYDKSEVDFYLKIVDYFGQDEKALIYGPELASKVKGSRWHSFLADKFAESGNLNWLDQLLYTDINSYLPDDLLVKVDIASMAHALEIRSPFLDQELLELTARMPSGLKMRGHNKKHLLKKIAYKYLPRECIDRPKQGFGVPLEFWFRNELLQPLRDHLLDTKFVNLGFKREGLEQLINDHASGRKNNAMQLWALLTLSIWFKQFLS